MKTYLITEAAEILGVSRSALHYQLINTNYAGCIRAHEGDYKYQIVPWLVTEQGIETIRNSKWYTWKIKKLENRKLKVDANKFAAQGVNLVDRFAAIETRLAALENPSNVLAQTLSINSFQKDRIKELETELLLNSRYTQSDIKNELLKKFNISSIDDLSMTEATKWTVDLETLISQVCK